MGTLSKLNIPPMALNDHVLWLSLVSTALSSKAFDHNVVVTLHVWAVANNLAIYLNPRVTLERHQMRCNHSLGIDAPFLQKPGDNYRTLKTQSMAQQESLCSIHCCTNVAASLSFRLLIAGRSRFEGS